MHTAPDRFISENPHYCVSALSRYTQWDFIDLVDQHAIAWHQKALGQLFCDGSSRQIIDMLTREMSDAGAKLSLATTVQKVTRNADASFAIETSDGLIKSASLVVATGGKSIPKMGATAFGYRIAEQFGLRVTETRPALVPLTFDPHALETLKPLSGLSAPSRISCTGQSFDEAMLFTHRGLSGPAILQISSYWREGREICVSLVPDIDWSHELKAAKSSAGRSHPQTVLTRHMPKRLAQMLTDTSDMDVPLATLSDAKLEAFATRLTDWRLKPTGSEGYRTAEVTLGGVDTRDLDSRTMAARNAPGLFFVGEVVDVTGWLGGYNFQWAWASGWAAGQVA